MKQIEYNFKGFKNIQLYGQAWVVDSPKANICFVHGIGEHSGRYTHVAEAFNAAGFSFFGFDQRGHGKSKGQRGHCSSIIYWVEDIKLFMNEVINISSTGNCIIYGHSLGGMEVLNYLLRVKPNLAGAIVTSPAIGLAFNPPKWKQIGGKIFNLLIPRLSMNSGLKVEDLSTDSEVGKKYSGDKLVHSKVTSRTYACMLNGGKWALENASKLSMPLLLMHGGEDKITSAEASQEFAKIAGDKVTFKKWPGLFHELHNETLKGEVLGEMIVWVNGLYLV